MTVPTDPAPRRGAVTVPTAVVALAALAALVLYALLWCAWTQTWPWLSWVGTTDTRALDAGHTMSEAHSWWFPLWEGISTVFAPGLWRVLVLVPVAVALYRRRVLPACFLAVAVWGGGVLSVTAKHLADRERPVTQMVAASGTSFPSGHALGVMVTAGALVVAVAWVAGRCPVPLIVAAAAVVLLVGVARVALNVHHPSDVVAGWALGFVWLVLCVSVFRAAGTRTAHGSANGR